MLCSYLLEKFQYPISESFGKTSVLNYISIKLQALTLREKDSIKDLFLQFLESGTADTDITDDTLREKYQNTESILVRIFLYSD